MLIAALVAFLFFGGSGATLMTDNIDRLHDSIKSELSKGNTRDAALDVAGKMKDINKDYGKADGKAEKALIKLIEDYDTSAADLQKHMAEVNESRSEYQQKMLAKRFDLKKTLTSDEWNKVFSAESDR
jgi:hypothetical protein